MHKLQHWRKNNKLTRTELAKKITHEHEVYCTYRNVVNWENGTMPSKRFLRAIMQFTNNEVTANDFV